MSFWQDRALPFIHSARTALIRTPVEVAIGLTLATILTWAIANGNSDAGTFAFRAHLTGYLALVATFGVSALHAFRAVSSRTRWLLTAAYLIACGLYGGLVFNPHLETELWRYAALALAATMGFGVLPAAISWRTRDERDAFWHFNARAIAQIINVCAYLAALYIGLALGLAAVNNLFELSLDGELWGYMFAWVGVALAPWLIASGLPALVSDGATLTSQARAGLTLLATYLILPLVSLYMFILYAYQLKVVASGFELPKNVMSFLTLGAAILLLIGMFIGDQLRRTEEGQGVFVRAAAILPAAFIPLLPMGLWAVLVRVHQHGWTEFRYARVLSLLCLFIIFSLSAWRLLRRQQQPLAATFATFGIAGVIAAVGPLSMTEVARRSQVARLEETLRANDLIGADGKLRKLNTPLTIKGEVHPQTMLDYIVSSHSHAPILHLYPDAILKDVPDNRNAYLASNHVGWSDNITHSTVALSSLNLQGQQEGLLTIPQGATRVLSTHAYTYDSYPNATHPRLQIDKNKLHLYEGATLRATHDLAPLVTREWQAAKKNATPHANHPLAEQERLITMRAADGAIIAWVLLKNLQILQPTPEYNSPSASWLEAVLFVP